MVSYDALNEGVIKGDGSVVEIALVINYNQTFKNI